ncbi:MAG: selenide, water dikinase SelD [Thermodesulfovibrionia bacterium]
MDLQGILEMLPSIKDPNLIVGYETGEDAGVYRLSEDIALIQTIDFFTPIANDPYIFGQIAVANALSDVYAMGGVPLLAMNVVCFPIKKIERDVLERILMGAVDKLREAETLLVGGHSVEDDEIKYGLSVTGVVHPDKVVLNSGARPGDYLILTKPIGTGIITTAIKGNRATVEAEERVYRVMIELNRRASEAMQKAGANACTDITGFGLIGHAYEMARASDVGIVLYASRIPIIEEAIGYAERGLIPEGSYRNKEYCEKVISVSPDIPPVIGDILFDAQTSGGLLISINPDRAAKFFELFPESDSTRIVGEVTEENKKMVIIKP